MQAAGLAGVTAAFFAFHLSTSQALAIVAAVMFVVVGDQVRCGLPLVACLLMVYLCTSTPFTKRPALVALCAWHHHIPVYFQCIMQVGTDSVRGLLTSG